MELRHRTVGGRRRYLCVLCLLVVATLPSCGDDQPSGADCVSDLRFEDTLYHWVGEDDPNFGEQIGTGWQLGCADSDPSGAGGRRVNVYESSGDNPEDRVVVVSQGGNSGALYVVGH